MLRIMLHQEIIIREVAKLVNKCAGTLGGCLGRQKWLVIGQELSVQVTRGCFRPAPVEGIGGLAQTNRSRQ
jgi:hypothetical protein